MRNLSAGFCLVLAAAAVVFFSPRPVYAWGCEGHQVVAQIAELELTTLNPTALSNAKALLAQSTATGGRQSAISAGEPSTWQAKAQQISSDFRIE